MGPMTVVAEVLVAVMSLAITTLRGAIGATEDAAAAPEMATPVARVALADAGR
jgi:hypothetical protein